MSTDKDRNTPILKHTAGQGQDTRPAYRNSRRASAPDMRPYSSSPEAHAFPETVRARRATVPDISDATTLSVGVRVQVCVCQRERREREREREREGGGGGREQFTHVRTACMMHTYIYSFFVSWHKITMSLNGQVVGLETEAARHLNGVRARVLRTQGKRFLIEVPSS